MKKIAKTAKKRLSSGYWEKLKQDNLSAIDDPTLPEYKKIEVLENYKKIASNTDKVCAFEDAFLEKVKKIMDSDLEILNPIKFLLDESDLADLSIDERQRLILKTSKMFVDAKEFLLSEQQKK